VLGKIASAIVAMLGVGIIAVPAGVLADALRADRDRDAQRQQAAQQEHAGEPARCPHCGEDLPDRGPR